MKSIIVRQNWRGKYDLLSGNETLSFIMDICEDKKTIEIDGVKARLYLNDDRDVIEDPLDNLGDVFNECWEYANSVWSSTDYKKQCLVFAKVFQDNFKELVENRIVKQKEEISQEIERLQLRLTRLYGYDDISYEVNRAILNKVASLDLLIQSNEQELAQVKEGTEKYNKISERIESYSKQKDFYMASKIKECDVE